MNATRLSVPAVLAAVWLAGAPQVVAQLPVQNLRPGIDVILFADPGGSGFVMNNLLLSGKDGAVLVDTLPWVPENGPFPGTFNLLNWTIQSLTGGGAVKALINTSPHFDHAGLNADFRSHGAAIIAHWREGLFLAAEQWCEDFAGFLGPTPPFPPEAQPTQVVHGEKRLFLNGERIILKTVENAHSGADLVVFFERANVVYTGDIYFGGMYPIIDRCSGGTINGTLHALRQILARIDDQTIIVPSHGMLGTRQSVLEFVQMLETARERVRKLIAAGLTEEKVLSLAPMADFDAEFGNGFVPPYVFTKIVYRDLAPQGRPKLSTTTD